MKLACFGPVGAEQPGLVLGEELVSLSLLNGPAGFPGFGFEQWLPLTAERSAAIQRIALDVMERIPLASVRLGSPLRHPGKIIGVGANYCSADGSKPTGPADPILFFKPASSLCGSTDSIRLPFEAGAVVAEVELAVILGSACHRIPPADALSHVFGYTIANDLTAPEILLGDSARSPLYLQQGRGKGFPTFCPLGPFIVTADDCVPVSSLVLEQSVNGLLQLRGTVSQMRHDIATLVSEASHAFGLQAGDVILTGSPRPAAGEPRQALQAGDLLCSRISGLGEMRNPVVAESGLLDSSGPLRRPFSFPSKY